MNACEVYERCVGDVTDIVVMTYGSSHNIVVHLHTQVQQSRYDKYVDLSSGKCIV